MPSSSPHLSFTRPTSAISLSDNSPLELKTLSTTTNQPPVILYDLRAPETSTHHSSLMPFDALLNVSMQGTVKPVVTS